jgi:hypothetical protein
MWLPASLLTNASSAGPSQLGQLLPKSGRGQAGPASEPGRPPRAGSAATCCHSLASGAPRDHRQRGAPLAERATRPGRPRHGDGLPVPAQPCPPGGRGRPAHRRQPGPQVSAPKPPVDADARLGHVKRRSYTPEEFGRLLAGAPPFYRDHLICLDGDHPPRWPPSERGRARPPTAEGFWRQQRALHEAGSVRVKRGPPGGCQG